MRGGPLSPEEQEFFLQVQQTASEEGWGGEGEAESAGTLDGEARCNSETKNPTSGGDFAAEEKGHCVAGDFDKASLAYCTKAALKTRLYEAAEFLVEGQRRQSGFSFFALDWRGLVKSQTKDARMSQKLKTQLQVSSCSDPPIPSQWKTLSSQSSVKGWLPSPAGSLFSGMHACREPRNSAWSPPNCKTESLKSAVHARLQLCL